MEIKTLEDKAIKIKWSQPLTLDVATGIDKDGEGIWERESFNKDETSEVDVFGIDEEKQSIEIQFGDSSCAFNVSMTLFEVLETE